MASRAALTVFFAFYVVFCICCFDVLPEPAAMAPRTTQSGRLLARLATAALVPAVVATLALAPLLLYAHVRALGRRGGAEAAGARLVVARLATATLLLAVAALLLAAAVVSLGGADDVGWLNVE